MPLLPGLRGAGDAGRFNRGDVWWASPQFPTGETDKEHMCVLLRTPRPREVNVPILTLHTLERKPVAVDDTCLELTPQDYKPIKVPTVIDARMTMFVPVVMLARLAFVMREEHVSELEDCLLTALEFGEQGRRTNSAPTRQRLSRWHRRVHGAAGDLNPSYRRERAG